MGTITHWGLAGFLAGAEKHLAVCLGLIGYWCKAAALVGAVTEGLGRGLSAGAPEIILASNHINGNRLLSGDYRLFHGELLQTLVWSGLGGSLMANVE